MSLILFCLRFQQHQSSYPNDYLYNRFTSVFFNHLHDPPSLTTAQKYQNDVLTHTHIPMFPYRCFQLFPQT